MNNVANLSAVEQIAKSGPHIRGSEAWAERETTRAILGAACVNPYEIPRGQAYGEPKAELQQVDTSMYVEAVREERAKRNQ